MRINADILLPALKSILERSVENFCGEIHEVTRAGTDTILVTYTDEMYDFQFIKLRLTDILFEVLQTEVNLSN